jgi:hypothetical protein
MDQQMSHDILDNRQKPVPSEREPGEDVELLVSPHEGDAPTLSARLQNIPHESYILLIEAMRLRGFCVFEPRTYEPVAPRSEQHSMGQSLLRAQELSTPPPLSEPGDGGSEAAASATAQARVRLGGSMRRLVDGSRLGLLLGPVPVPVQEDLCRFWIERRTGIDLEPERPLADALVNGYLLCRLIDTEPAAQPPRVNIPWRIAERNISLFLQLASRKGLSRGDLFESQDLLYRRNVPRVLRTVAAIARKTDPEGFRAVAADLPGSRLQWTQADEPDEFWRGDWMITRLVKSYQRSSLCGKLGIVVVGAQGGGKSATVDMLMGRQFMEPSHAIRYMPEDTFFEEKEQRIIQDFRRAAVKHWPHHMFERGTPTSSIETCKMYVKVAGVSLQVIELPSMEMHVERVEINGLVLSSETGRFDEVVRSILDDAIDLVLLVERLDDFPRERVAKICRKLQRLYGDNVWSRTVVVLTHGYSLPPAGTLYEDLVTERVDEIQALVRRISGDSAAAVPVVVVENSASCPRDPSTGRPVLPNGADFQVRLVEAMEHVLAAHHGVDSLTAVGMRKWWQHYAGAAILCWLISRL